MEPRSTVPRGRLRGLTIAVGVTTLIAALLVGPANAAPSDAAPSDAALTGPAVDRGIPGAALETIASAYREAHPEMSPAAARAAAAEQTRRRQLLSKITQDPATFGGAWFDPPSGVLHVAVTTTAAGSATAALGRDLGIRVQTRLVGRSLAELERSADALRVGTDALGAAADGNVGIDVKENRVVVAVPARRMAALRSVPSADGVTVVARSTVRDVPDVCTSRSNCDDSLRAGLILAPSGCSLGWMAHDTRTPSVRWLMTAGHCSTGVGVTWSTAGTNIGTLRGATNSGRVDVSFIEVTNPTYANDSIGRLYSHTSANRFVRLNGAATSMAQFVVGETACLAANATDLTGTNRCGVIGSVSDAQRRGMVRVDNEDACGGDSGGGWYELNADGTRIALGMHSSSSQSCHDESGHSNFTPLPAIGSISVDV
ncbi:trypsin-like serine protease [Plantactinospora sp. WMMB334]|uniref:trypsin-like serine protease n=1 Tax=Plantactinospora sp. WMMB334 TaxID=3404119 RepID=UPI003B959523